MSGIMTGALRESARIDLRRFSPWGGVVRALPVVCLVAFGLGIGSPKTALTLGIGANLVAVVSLIGQSRVATSVITFDVVGLGCSSFVGAATAFNSPLHLAVLAIWCFAVGILVTFGLGPATAGVQSIVAFVVFGRFADGPLGALLLGALVASGAAIEALVLLALRLPASTRAQRGGIALAYDRLATLTEGVDTNAIEVAADLDSASQLINPRTFSGGTHDFGRLQSLIDEARRARLELIALNGLRDRLEQQTNPSLQRTVGRVLLAANRQISGIAVALRSQKRANSSGIEERELARQLAALRELVATTHVDDPITTQLLSHLEALAGQLRAVTSLLAAPQDVDRSRPLRGKSSLQLPTVRDIAAISSSNLALIRESLTLSSSTFRHALRLAIAVPASELIANALDLPRSYWVAFTVAVVLKPDYSSLFRRGLGRVVGTIVGATLAALIVGGLHPDTLVTVLLVGICAWAAYSLWQSSFAVGIGFVTALVLFLLSTTQVDTLSTATDRLIDTVLGGAIALGIYVVWPTWASTDAYEALRHLIDNERAYLSTLFEAIEADRGAVSQLSDRARSVRLSFGTAEAALGRSMDEPRRHRFDDEFGRSFLAAARRVVQSAHSLRSEVERGLSIDPLPPFENLASLLNRALSTINAELGGASQHEVPQLRDQYHVVATALENRGASPVIALQLDEIIDAVNTIEAIVAEHNDHNRSGEHYE